MTIELDIHKQSINSGLVFLYEVYIAEDFVLYLTSEESEITFRENTYIPIPIELEDIQATSSGSLPRPLLTISSLRNEFSNLLGDVDYGLIVGKKLIRRATFEKYLETGEELRPSSFVIDRIQARNITGVTYELASPFDLEGTSLPRRKILGGLCPWKYKGAAVELKEHQKVGGCKWSLRGNIDRTQNAIFINKNDEFIVDEALLTLYDENIDIEIGKFYYTLTGATKLSTTGESAGFKTVKDVWHAQSAQTPPHSSPPLNASAEWSRARCFKRYTDTQDYFGYIESEYNDYVYTPFVGSTLSEFSTQDSKGVPGNPTSDQETNGVLSGFAQQNNLTLATEYSQQFFIFPYDSNKNIVHILFNGRSSRMAISSLVFSDPNLGLSADTNYGIVEYENRKYIITKVDAETLILDEDFNPNLVELFQVKEVTVESDSFSHYPNIQSRLWTIGDKCGKTLESCSKRFRTSVLKGFRSSPDSIPVTLGIRSNVASDFTLLDSGENAHGIKVPSELRANLPSTGIVFPFLMDSGVYSQTDPIEGSFNSPIPVNPGKFTAKRSFTGGSSYAPIEYENVRPSNFFINQIPLFSERLYFDTDGSGSIFGLENVINESHFRTLVQLSIYNTSLPFWHDYATGESDSSGIAGTGTAATLNQARNIIRGGYDAGVYSGNARSLLASSFSANGAVLQRQLETLYFSLMSGNVANRYATTTGYYYPYTSTLTGALVSFAQGIPPFLAYSFADGYTSGATDNSNTDTMLLYPPHLYYDALEADINANDGTTTNVDNLHTSPKASGALNIAPNNATYGRGFYEAEANPMNPYVPEGSDMFFVFEGTGTVAVSGINPVKNNRGVLPFGGFPGTRIFN
jgi:lambda family phage minor tail protein L